MLAFGLLLSIPALVFAFRWFRHHAFEHFDGVSPRSQIDSDFVWGIIFGILSILFLIFGSAST